MNSTGSSPAFKELSILVSSFDTYSMCWPPFVHGLRKYWPDHPENVFFITNHKEAPFGKTIQVGPDRGWACNLRMALDQIQFPYILYAQEDYWIDSQVSTETIASYLPLLENDLVDYIRLYPAPGPDMPFPWDERLGLIQLTSQYRASLQMALWRKDVLKELLVDRESPWNFEVQGSKRSVKFGNRFGCVKKKRNGISYVFTAIIGGEWSAMARTYAAREGIVVAFDELPQKPWKKKAVDRMRSWLFACRKKIIRSLRKR